MGSLKLWNFETLKPRNQETKKPRNQTKNPPTPQHTDSHPCTSPPLGDTRELGGHEWSVFVLQCSFFRLVFNTWTVNESNRCATAPNAREKAVNFKCAGAGFALVALRWMLCQCCKSDTYVASTRGNHYTLLENENVSEIYPNFHFVFLIDIDPVSKTFKTLLNGSSSFVGAHRFENCPEMEFDFLRFTHIMRSTMFP